MQRVLQVCLCGIVLAIVGCGPQPAPAKLGAHASSEFTSPLDANGVSLGVSSYPIFQDGAATPLVSPQTGTTLTLTRPIGAIRVHVSCSVAFTVGNGTMDGSSGKGYVTMGAGQWWGTECAALDSIPMKTTAGGSGVWSYCFDVYAGN